MKGIAVRLPNGAVRRVEIHWYEAHEPWDLTLRVTAGR